MFRSARNDILKIIRTTHMIEIFCNYCASLFVLFFFFGLLAGDLLSQSACYERWSPIACFAVFSCFFLFGFQAEDSLSHSMCIVVFSLFSMPAIRTLELGVLLS